jgi:GDPmannose 4,6-dehydratase
MKKTALITGITGQDGSYLSKLLLEKGYTVYGMMSRSTRYAFSNLDYLGVTKDVNFLDGDMTDEASLIHAVRRSAPDEVYNLAAQSFVAMSWDQPLATADINAIGTLRLLEAVRGFAPRARFYQASTSEMFGKSNQDGIQSEETPFHPQSPYAIAKLFAFWIVNNYRASYGMFCANGILFNHESPIRGKEFVTRKISYNVAKIRLGLSERFALGNLDSRRDWGFAGDYVEAMHLILQQDVPENFLLSTGETHSIREFLNVAFNHVGIADWEKHVYLDPAFNRPSELFCLQGSCQRAQDKLKWRPTVGFEELVRMMVEADLARLRAVPNTEA